MKSSSSSSSSSPAVCLASLLLLMLGVLLVPRWPGAHAISLCKPLPVPESDECQFGTERDFCGRTVCAKGPGERCGGPSNVLGKCGDGTHCKCGRCIGCSLHTFTCDLGSSICF